MYLRLVQSTQPNPIFSKKCLFANELKELKQQLDDEKNKMNSYDPKVLHKKILTLFPYDNVKYSLRKKFDVPFITTAWLKTYEIFDYFKIKGLVFFNANAPGTSSHAYEQYLTDNYPGEIPTWVASTYVSGSLGDTYGLIQQNKHKWLMTDYNNGDTTKVDNILDFANQLRTKFNKLCDIYFSDIGIEIHRDFNNEELLECKEVLGQNITGLHCLGNGGTFIVKQRGMQLPVHIWFISQLHSLFETVNIIKPKASKPCNSEIYIVGLNFKGISPKLMDCMFRLLVGYNKTLTPFRIRTAISMDLYQIIFNIIKEIYQHQMDNIKKLNL